MFVEDGLDEHEQVSESPREQEADEHQVNSEEKLPRKNDEGPALTKEVTEEGQVNLESCVQDQSIAVEQTAEEQQNGATIKKENEQPTFITSLLLTADGPGSVHGPGPLVTELQDEEQLENIHLSVHRSLRISDLPDLEDVDMEEFGSPQQVITPKIEVLSESCDGEAAGAPSDGTSTVNPSESFHRVAPTSAGLFRNSSLLYPEDTVVQQAKSREHQHLSIQVSLIEELD